MRAPGWWARGAFLALAAAAHVLFLGRGSDALRGDLSLLPFAAPNLLVLGWVAARRGDPLQPLVPAFGAAVPTVLLGPWVDFTDNSNPLLRYFLAIVVALFGATVVTPLSLTLDRWRREPCPATALDAWTTLALSTMASFLLDPAHKADVHLGPRVDLDTLLRAALFAAMIFGLGVWVAEIVAFVRVARARSGRVAGLAVSDDAPKPWGLVSALPSWRLTVDDRLAPLVHTEVEGGYRDDARGKVVARIPAQTTWSWRLWVLPLAVAFCALRLAR